MSITQKESASALFSRLTPKPCLDPRMQRLWGIAPDEPSVDESHDRNKVTQQKKQNANTIEGVKNMHRQYCPSWDDCKKVTLTAS